eukprot:scaffold14599_cov33-Phaeocystis_antarctica.AAC.1
MDHQPGSVRFWRCCYCCYCCNSGFRCARAAAEFGPLRRRCGCAVVEDIWSLRIWLWHRSNGWATRGG